MALFFDLSIPFLDSAAAAGTSSSSESKARKDVRLKAVVRAMELGYAGVAYDRPFRGVLSDAERCQIPPFPLSSLLKVAPALAASASFHRDLLGAPLSVPFRQYTRLTVSAPGSPAVLSLNGCHVLRTYDLVAVRPLSQDAFDKACEASEVNIITLDISQKLPFRLKLPLVKLAIQRGLYFEITYSHLIGDVHVRRQILSDVKLLAEWTCGKNLIISSAAANVNDVRGPHDVINLAAYLLGLSVERARACISGNCRVLVADALKKKQFHKEAIKVERITPSEQLDSRRFWIGDWKNYDPLSSGEGDLPSLDDISKSSSSASKPSVHVNSIDFTLLTNEAPFILGQNAAMLSSPKKVSQSAASRDARYVSDDANHYDIPIMNNSLITLSPLGHKKSSCQDAPAPISGSDIPMPLAEAKNSGLIAETYGKFKGFDESALATEAVPISSPNDCESPCDIPSAFNDATPEVNRCLNPLAMMPLEQQKPDFEDSPASDHVTLITETRESVVVEIDGNLKTSDECCFTSDRITTPSCITTLRACNSIATGDCVLSLNSNPSFLASIEDEVPDIVMKDHESSHLSNKSQIKMSKDIAETMESTPMTAHDQILPKDGHLSFASLMDKNILEEQVETNVLEQDQKDEMMIDDEMSEQVFLHPQPNNKGSNVISSGSDVIGDGFVKTKVQKGETLLFENDASLEDGVVVLKTLTIEAEPSKTKSANKEASDAVMEDHEISNPPDKSESKISKAVVESIECTPITAHDRISPNDVDSSFTSLSEENMLLEQVEMDILEQQQKDENMIDNDTLEKKVLLHPQLNNKRHSATSVKDAIEDAFVETKVQDGQTILLENDASSKADMVTLKEDITKMPLITEATPCKTKPGSRRHKRRLLRPAHPLPFKGLFKPMLYRKKLQKSKGPSNMS